MNKRTEKNFDYLISDMRDRIEELLEDSYEDGRSDGYDEAKKEFDKDAE